MKTTEEIDAIVRGWMATQRGVTDLRERLECEIYIIALQLATGELSNRDSRIILESLKRVCEPII